MAALERSRLSENTPESLKPPDRQGWSGWSSSLDSVTTVALSGWSIRSSAAWAVMQNVEPRLRIWNAAHQRRHWTREEGHGEKELFLAPAEPLQRHGTILECDQIGIASKA